MYLSIFSPLFMMEAPSFPTSLHGSFCDITPSVADHLHEMKPKASLVEHGRFIAMSHWEENTVNIL